MEAVAVMEIVTMESIVSHLILVLKEQPSHKSDPLFKTFKTYIIGCLRTALSHTDRIYYAWSPQIKVILNHSIRMWHWVSFAATIKKMTNAVQYYNVLLKWNTGHVRTIKFAEARSFLTLWHVHYFPCNYNWNSSFGCKFIESTSDQWRHLH